MRYRPVESVTTICSPWRLGEVAVTTTSATGAWVWASTTFPVSTALEACASTTEGSSTLASSAAPKIPGRIDLTNIPPPIREVGISEGPSHRPGATGRYACWYVPRRSWSSADRDVGFAPRDIRFAPLQSVDREGRHEEAIDPGRAPGTISGDPFGSAGGAAQRSSVRTEAPRRSRARQLR